MASENPNAQPETSHAEIQTYNPPASPAITEPRADEAAPSSPHLTTCTCGRPNGVCVCEKPEYSNLTENAPPSYVYSIGRIEPDFPIYRWSGSLLRSGRSKGGPLPAKPSRRRSTSCLRSIATWRA